MSLHHYTSTSIRDQIDFLLMGIGRIILNQCTIYIFREN